MTTTPNFSRLQDLSEKFSLDRLNPSPAAINFSKLDYFNGLHIRSLAIDDLARRIKPFFLEKNLPADDARLLKIAPIIQERLVTLDDAVALAGFFFEDKVTPAPEELVAKGLSASQSAEVAKVCLAVLDKNKTMIMQSFSRS